MKNSLPAFYKTSTGWIAGAVVAAVLIVSCGREEPAASASTGETDASRAPPETTGLPRTPAPADARVFFITPEDGAVVSNPVNVEFGIEGMDVVPAGTVRPNTGHHHLLVDTGLPDLSRPIPADDNHIHFGDGSTSTELTLAPGQHTLCLLLGDHLHIPHDPPVKSPGITITVE